MFRGKFVLLQRSFKETTIKKYCNMKRTLMNLIIYGGGITFMSYSFKCERVTNH